MTMALAQTVSDWRARGYLGLHILRCPDCCCGTYRTWAELEATPSEDVFAVAHRVRCQKCKQVPAGLAVVTYRDPNDGSWS